MKRKAATLIAGIVLLAALPLSVSGYAVKDARRLADALLGSADMNKADDLNGDGTVNAVDLTLLKREMLTEESGPATKQTVKPDADSVRIIGRTVTDQDILWLVQSGAAAECTVTGTAASVTIAGDGNVSSDPRYRPRYGVYVDGELVKDVVMGEAEQTVELFSGSAQRTAEVKVIHISEANNGAIGVKQFDVTSAAKDPVRPTAKKDLTVEFIGDSITCGYGVEAPSQNEGFSTGTENFTLSYAYLAAQILDADYSAVAYSGHGVLSGYSNNGQIQKDSLVPDYYQYVGKFGSYKTPWDFEANPSDVIVLNLGTNDDSYAKDDLETRGPLFQTEYTKFLKTIRQYNPDSAIVCTLGIMGCTELYPYIEAAVAEVGDAKISCYEAPVQKQSDGYGADWHPSPKTQELNAYLLADKICNAIGRESSKIGIDLAQDGEYGADIDKESGVNAWPYVSDWDKSINVNISAAATEAEAITVYVRGLTLPKGTYELAFKAERTAGDIPYAIRSRSDPEKTYLTGTLTEASLLKSFELTEAADDAEIVFFPGKLSGSVTFRDITLFKRG